MNEWQVRNGAKKLYGEKNSSRGEGLGTQQRTMARTENPLWFKSEVWHSLAAGLWASLKLISLMFNTGNLIASTSKDFYEAQVIQLV